MQKYYEKQENPKIKKRKIAGVFLIGAGLVTLVYFFFPILSYEMFIAGAISQGSLEVPIPKYLVVSQGANLGSLVSSGIDSITRNYHDARSWYPNIPSTTKGKTKVSEYKLSIPKLKIENAVVSTTDYDLDRHLIQYFGTSTPGERGTSVIFGHSTIPAWFDPKNYKTIFATLHKIKVGDEIDAQVGDSIYHYRIFSMLITTPEDTNILSQSYDNSYITIVTCTPPGTIWKRLVIRAALVGAKI